MNVFNVLCVEEKPYEQANVSVKPYATLQQASSATKKSYEKEWKKLEEEGYVPEAEGDYESCLCEHAACLNYGNKDGIVNIQWSIVMGPMDDVSLTANTPMGTLVGELATDSEHPGISVDLDVNGKRIPLALVEFCKDEGDLEEPHIITRVWGDDQIEDYTDRVVHKLSVPDRNSADGGFKGNASKENLWSVRTTDGKTEHIIASQEELDKMVEENRIQQYACACTVHGTGSPD